MSTISRSIRRSAGPFALLVASIVGASCASLPTIAANQCGNGVIESGEDCDGFAAKGNRCRGAAEASSCRFDCAKSACPTGYLCGADTGICAQPSGAFEANEVKIDVPAARVQLGDFNGDGVHDILARTHPDEAARESLRVLYLEPGAQSTSRIFPIHALAISPQIVNATTPDTFDDLFFGSANEGLDVFLGSADGTMSPLAFARFPLPNDSIVRMTMLHGVASTVSAYRELPLVFLQSGGKNVFTIGSGTTDPLAGILGLLPQDVAKLLGTPVTTNILEVSTCDEVVLAFQGGSDVAMYSPCFPSGVLRTKETLEPAPTKILSLPGKIITEPPIATDLNGDGHQDIILRANELSYVAFGRGDGTFSSSADLTATTDLSVLTCYGDNPLDPTPPPVPLPMPCSALAVESARSSSLGQHVVTTNAIFRLDKVTSVGVGTQIHGTVLGTQSGGGWTTAKIADFNRDGIVDIAAASSTALDIDFFTGSGGVDGFFNPSKVQTTAPVRQLDVGDYDGDLVNDLAIIELDAAGTDVDAIDVAYGKTAGPPDAPFRMGVFPKIRQIATGRFSGLDSIDELGLVYTTDRDLITVLDGQGDRQLLSPFGLTTSIDGALAQANPLGIALGQFDADPLPDAVIFGYDQNKDARVGLGMARLWLAPVSGQARMTTSTASAVIPGINIVIGAETADDPTFALSGLVRTGDLDGDGIDEALALAPTRDKQSATLTIAKVTGDPKSPSFTVTKQVELPPTWVPTGESDLVAQDIDGDGKKDIVVLCQGRRGRAAFFVLWNDGTGDFNLDQRTTIAPLDPDEHVLGMTPIVGGQGLVAPLVAITAKATYLVRPASPQVPRDLSLYVVSGISGGLSIAAGDVSADGVPDLVIASGPSVIVHRGIARQP